MYKLIETMRIYLQSLRQLFAWLLTMGTVNNQRLSRGALLVLKPLCVNIFVLPIADMFISH